MHADQINRTPTKDSMIPKKRKIRKVSAEKITTTFLTPRMLFAITSKISGPKILDRFSTAVTKAISQEENPRE